MKSSNFQWKHSSLDNFLRVCIGFFEEVLGIHWRHKPYLWKTLHFSCCLDQYPKILYSSRRRHPLAPSQLHLAPAPSALSSLVGSRVCQCCGPYLPFHSRYQQPEVVHLERSKNFLLLLHNHCWDIRLGVHYYWFRYHGIQRYVNVQLIFVSRMLLESL